MINTEVLPDIAETKFLGHPAEMKPFLPEKRARQLLKWAERNANIHAGRRSHPLIEGLGALLYHSIIPGGDKIARRIAPAAIADINLQRAGEIFNNSKRPANPYNRLNGNRSAIAVTYNSGEAAHEEEQLPQLQQADNVVGYSVVLNNDLLNTKVIDLDRKKQPAVDTRKTDWERLRRESYEEWDIWRDKGQEGSEQDPLAELELRPDMCNLVTYKRGMNGAVIYTELDTEKARKYVAKRAGVDKNVQHDLIQMVMLMLNKPKGTGSKVHTTYIPIQGSSLRAWEFKPGDVPGLLLLRRDSYLLRIFYAVNESTQPNTIILKGIYDKKQMDRGDHLR